MNLWLGNKYLWVGFYSREFSLWGRDEQIVGQWERDFPHPSSRETSVVLPKKSVKNFKPPIWLSPPTGR